MRPLRLSSLVAGLLVLWTGAAGAQQWNSPEALALVRRGVARRLETQPDSTLSSYATRAHGFVFFLAQLGEGLNQPPRLVKADQLEVQVYWQAPNRSKQVILGWRDGTWLPTDISYHRDHLGIVTNNFGTRIRIGEGDEVRDVVHPLSAEGLERYDFAVVDSVSVEAGGHRLQVYAVSVRPRSFREPLVVGTLYLEAGSADLVRFRFSFTPAAYLDRELEDITIVLESSLWNEKYWLPYRQEIEIRRRTTWLDFPARGIIRGRWEIGDYAFNTPISPEIFRGPAIAGLAAPRKDSVLWAGQPSLDSAVAGVAAPLNRQDMESLRVEVERIAGTRALSGLASTRLAAGSLSDIVHVNRVQGLALGFGAVLAVPGSRIQARPWIGFGTSDHRVLGSVQVSLDAGSTSLTVSGGRRIRDLSDYPVISGVFNSIAAQEFGDDYGDYVLVEDGRLELKQRLSVRTSLGLGAFLERSTSVAVAHAPATGRYRANPALGAGEYRGGTFTLERGTAGIGARRELMGSLNLEAADGPSTYARATMSGLARAGLGGSELQARWYLGWGSAGLPAYRSFVLGGRNTLVGEPFRAFGGRSAALARLEWRFEVPVPALSLGSFASTGRTMTVAPFVAAGWTGRAEAGTPWPASPGVRPVAGIAIEWFMHLVRLEAGVGLRSGNLGVTVDIHPDWWGVL